MRTTLEIDDDVLQAARSMAAAEGQSIGKALSAIARRGLAPQSQSKSRSGFPVFDVTSKVAPLTLEMVKDAMDED